MGRRLGCSATTGTGTGIGRRTTGRIVTDEKRKLREKDEGENCHIGYPDAEASHESVYGRVIPSWKKNKQAKDEEFQVVEKGNCNPNNSEGHTVNTSPVKYLLANQAIDIRAHTYHFPSENFVDTLRTL